MRMPVASHLAVHQTGETRVRRAAHAPRRTELGLGLAVTCATLAGQQQLLLGVPVIAGDVQIGQFLGEAQ